jgi:predicted ribosomally synthesized peptide with SipW-like signal peptide
MKKILPLAASVMIVLIASVFASAGTLAIFTDTEVSAGNTFTAGILDLKVDDADSPVVPWSMGPMEPGDTYFTGFKTLKNVGNVDGCLTVTISNLICAENGREEPEKAAGDPAGSQWDPDGFSQDGGNGELWDQVLFSFVIDNGDGTHQAPTSWLDTTIGLYPDESSYYSIDVDSPITLDTDFDPGEEIAIGIKITFIDDLNEPYSWILDGVPNNAAMGDTIQMDLVFDLVQN